MRAYLTMSSRSKCKILIQELLKTLQLLWVSMTHSKVKDKSLESTSSDQRPIHQLNLTSLEMIDKMTTNSLYSIIATIKPFLSWTSTKI